VANVVVAWPAAGVELACTGEAGLVAGAMPTEAELPLDAVVKLTWGTVTQVLYGTTVLELGIAWPDEGPVV
jgi:hypothetical protein